MSLSQAGRDEIFNTFSEPCERGDCTQGDLQARINNLPSANQSLTLQIMDLPTTANLDLDAQQLAEALMTELYDEGKLKAFLDKNAERKEFVAAELQGWLDIFINARKPEVVDIAEVVDFPEIEENSSTNDFPSNTQTENGENEVRGENTGEQVTEKKATAIWYLS